MIHSMPHAPNNLVTKIYDVLTKNPNITVVKETLVPIILEEETVQSAMCGEMPIKYGLPDSLNTPFNNITLHIAPKYRISDMTKFSTFKKTILDENHKINRPSDSQNTDLEINDQTIRFPHSYYPEKVGQLSIINPTYSAIIKDHEGTELSSTHFDETQEPYTKTFDITASIAVFVYPNSEIADAVLDGSLEWHDLDDGESGYLRTELKKYEPNLGPPTKIDNIKKFFKL
ncbi:MAG: hypothetical protein GQ477_05500 [Nanohaloarchaea archaeon]|nr:hypothetical protein [Candidatus Nanohaloarchaea archaeon]